jgi:hypothetical protein
MEDKRGVNCSGAIITVAMPYYLAKINLSSFMSANDR